MLLFLLVTIDRFLCNLPATAGASADVLGLEKVHNRGEVRARLGGGGGGGGGGGDWGC